MFLNRFDDGASLDGFFNLKNFFKGAVDLAKNPFKTPLKHLRGHIAVITKPKSQELPPEWVAPPLPPSWVAPQVPSHYGAPPSNALVAQQRFQAQGEEVGVTQNSLSGVPLWAWGAGAGMGLLGLYLLTSRKSGKR